VKAVKTVRVDDVNDVPDDQPTAMTMGAFKDLLGRIKALEAEVAWLKDHRHYTNQGLTGEAEPS
jgi:hypothetical protein